MGFWQYEIQSFLKMPSKIPEDATLIVSTPSINLFPFFHSPGPLSYEMASPIERPSVKGNTPPVKGSPLEWGQVRQRNGVQALQKKGGQALHLLTIALKPHSNKTIYQEIL